MKYLLSFSILLACLNSLGQRDTLFGFMSDPFGFKGFRKADGTVVIPENIMGCTQAERIIHLAPILDSSYHFYYLFSDGRKWEQGSPRPYTIEMMFDYESDGMLRIMADSSSKVGFMDSTGTVSIPTIYDAAEQFHHGFAWVLQGAEQYCWDEDVPMKDCEHKGWRGGHTNLINRQGKVIATLDGTSFPPYLNYYEYRTDSMSPDTNCYTTISTVDGGKLHFIDFEKEFTNWLPQFIAACKDHQLDAMMNDRLLMGPVPRKGSVAKKDVIEPWGKTIRADFAYMVLKPEKTFSPSSSPWSSSTISKRFIPERYFDNSGCVDPHRYPMFAVWVGDHNVYTFLRKEEGYRLVGIDFR